MKTYLLWIEARETDPDDFPECPNCTEYTDCHCAADCIGEFKSLEHAMRIYNSLHIVTHAYTIQSWAKGILRRSEQADHLDTGEVIDLLTFIATLDENEE